MNNETSALIEEVITTLHIKECILKKDIRALACYFGLSHTAIYNMIKKNRITIKFFKAIKTDENLKGIITIKDEYIFNNILGVF